MMVIKNIKKAIELPHDWDSLATSYFQQKDFLIHVEKYNPCGQSYYLGYKGVTLVSAAVLYSLHLDIFTYLKIKSPIKMNIVGIPCSVSSSGIFGESEAVEQIKKHMYSSVKGFLLMLNLTEKPKNMDVAYGKTLPTIVFQNSFENWDDYLSSLRSDYRRRLHKINNGKGIVYKKSLCTDFTPQMHEQYLQVYKRSKGKLEQLDFDFFKNLPGNFILTQCKKYDQLLGWNIALKDKETYYFFLGGIDYKSNKQHNTYLRLLTQLLKDGIESGAARIELGQTAEIPKMRLGGVSDILFMEARHSNKMLNSLLKIFSKSLEYKSVEEVPHPLKNKSL